MALELLYSSVACVNIVQDWLTRPYPQRGGYHPFCPRRLTEFQSVLSSDEIDISKLNSLCFHGQYIHMILYYSVNIHNRLSR